MRRDRDTSSETRIVDYFFRNQGYIFSTIFVLCFVLVGIINQVASLTIYEVSMLLIGSTQIIIVSYLSFKIFEISKRDSEIPILAYSVLDVEEVDAPPEDHRDIRCTVGFINRSYGRAKITDIGLSTKFNERRLEKHKKPGEGVIASGLPYPIPAPTILDKGEVLEIDLIINGYQYLDEVTLNLDEKQLGLLEVRIPLFDINAELSFREAECVEN